MNAVEVHGSKIEAWVHVGDIGSLAVINAGSDSKRILTVSRAEDAWELCRRFKDAATRLEKGQ